MKSSPPRTGPPSSTESGRAEAPAWASLAHGAAEAPVALLILDSSGTIRAANREAFQIFALDNESEAIGRKAAEFLGPESGEARNALRACLAGGAPFNKLVSIDREGSERLDCHLRIHRVEGEEFYALWLNDVTDYVSMQRSMLSTDRLSALGDIVGGVAHELNNPLTAVMGYAQLLQSHADNDKDRKRLEQIVNEAMRCQAIVGSLLGFSRRGEAEKGYHNLNAIVRAMVALLDYQLRSDEIEIDCEYDESMPDILMDSHEVGRAILNILHNAQQALNLKDGPRALTITTQARDAFLSVSIRDNGPGIPLDAQSKIFDPFFTLREFGESVGLGLSVAYGSVSAHGGRIEVVSEPGSGAEFIVLFPRSLEGR